MWDRQLGSLKDSFIGFATLLMIEAIRGERSVGGVMERGGFDEPWVMGLPHRSAVLTWQDSTSVMNQPLWQYDSGRKIILLRLPQLLDCIADLRRNRGMIGSIRGIWVEALREPRLASEHDVMTRRMIVRRMCQGSAK